MRLAITARFLKVEHDAGGDAHLVFITCVIAMKVIPIQTVSAFRALNGLQVAALTFAKNIQRLAQNGMDDEAGIVLESPALRAVKNEEYEVPTDRSSSAGYRYPLPPPRQTELVHFFGTGVT
jgi:hypothetical protein